jgi:YVTN family beta-propeller protein
MWLGIQPTGRGERLLLQASEGEELMQMRVDVDQVDWMLVVRRLRFRARATSAPLAVAATLLSIAAVAGPAPAWAQDAREFVYTANEYGNSVSAIDLTNGTVETVAVPISPHNIQISPDGTRLLAVGDPADAGHAHGNDEDGGHGANGGHGAGGAQGLLVVLDPDELGAEPLATVPVGDHPAHVVVDGEGQRAFVTNAGDDAVAVVDIAASQLIGTVETGRYPHGLRISPDGGEVYVAAVEEGAISVISTDTLTETARIPVGAAPVQVGFLPDGSLVYVSLRDENRVAVIDTASREVVGRIEVGRNPIQVHATPDGARVYVANQGTADDPDDTVSVIDVATSAVVDTIRTGQGAHGVSVSNDGSRVFVTNIGDGTVSVIDDAARAVVATFQTGEGPNGITFRSAAD